jgi:hypothetical protein
MPFSGVYSLGASSAYGERTLASHKQISAESGFQLPSSVSSALTTLFWQFASLTRSPKNLTEFPFGPNFSKPDLEGI